MTIQLAFFLFLIFAAFSTETASDEEILSEQLTTENDSDQEALSQLMQELEQQVENLRKREQSVKLAEKRLHAREKKFHEFQQEKLKQIGLMDQFAQDLQNLEETLQKREQSVTGREEKLSAREKRLNEREEKLQKKSEGSRLQREHLKTQRREQSIHSTELNETNLRNYGTPADKIKMTEILEPTNLFPNESSVTVFRNEETNQISWKDPQNLIHNEFKAKLETSLQEKGEKMANGLFDCISNSFLPREPKPFIEKLISTVCENVDVHKRDRRNKTPLLFFADCNAEKAVARLIERHAKMEAADDYGCTALHCAAQKGHASSCKVLLQKGGANVNSQDRFGWTALSQAAYSESTEVVKILLQNGANTKIKDYFGNKIWMQAPKACVDLIEAHEAKLKI